jgi:hypothetical protein
MASWRNILIYLLSITQMSSTMSSFEKGHGIHQSWKTIISSHATAFSFHGNLVDLHPSFSQYQIFSKRRIAARHTCRSEKICCNSLESTELETRISRGNFLLRKYQQVRGLYLPLLSDDEEALFEGYDNERPAADVVPGTVRDSRYAYSYLRSPSMCNPHIAI